MSYLEGAVVVFRPFDATNIKQKTYVSEYVKSLTNMMNVT